MSNQQFDRDLSYLTLFSAFLGVMNYSENLRQTSNNELMEELKKQTKGYMEKIMEQNEEILSLLRKEVL